MAAEYQALVEKLEAFTSDTSARRAEDMRCHKGCDTCCKVWLSVGPLEAQRMRLGLAGLGTERRVRVRARGLRELAREADAEPTPRCAMLEDDGSCAIYAHRPLVCRSQGHALRYPQGFIPDAAVRLRTRSGDVTWCPLNYTGASPLAEDILDAERVDQILAVVTRRGVSGPEAALERSPVSALAAADD